MIFYIRMQGRGAVDQYYLNCEMKIMLHDSIRVSAKWRFG